MRKICFGIVGILACLSTPLFADGYREDEPLLADKDFPFPPDESELPENVPIEEGNAAPYSQQPSQKQTPAKKSGGTKASKDIFPPNPDEMIPS